MCCVICILGCWWYTNSSLFLIRLLEQFSLAVNYGGKGGKTVELNKKTKCLQIPVLPLPGSLTSGKLFSFSEFPFSLLKNAGNDDYGSSPLVGSWRNGYNALHIISPNTCCILLVIINPLDYHAITFHPRNGYNSRTIIRFNSVGNGLFFSGPRLSPKKRF